MIQGLPGISAQGEGWDLQGGAEQLHQHLDPGSCICTAAGAEPGSELNTIIHRLELSGTETFLCCRCLNLPNAFSKEGSKREFFEHVKTPHFHIF